MVLLRRGRRYFVGSASFVELGILAQLIVHFVVEGVGKYDGRLNAYIYCMISTIDLFNFSLVSQSTTNLFFLGSQYLNTCSSFVLLQVITLTLTMLIETITTLTSVVGLNFVD
jgi:hypothetical protein